jgi:hypothetical protein
MLLKRNKTRFYLTLLFGTFFENSESHYLPRSEQETYKILHFGTAYYNLVEEALMKEKKLNTLTYSKREEEILKEGFLIFTKTEFVAFLSRSLEQLI